MLSASLNSSPPSWTKDGVVARPTGASVVVALSSVPEANPKRADATLALNVSMTACLFLRGIILHVFFSQRKKGGLETRSKFGCCFGRAGNAGDQFACLKLNPK